MTAVYFVVEGGLSGYKLATFSDGALANVRQALQNQLRISFGEGSEYVLTTDSETLPDAPPEPKVRKNFDPAAGGLVDQHPDERVIARYDSATPHHTVTLRLDQTKSGWGRKTRATTVRVLRSNVYKMEASKVSIEVGDTFTLTTALVLRGTVWT